MQKDQMISNLKKYEPLLFWLMVIIGTLPLLVTKYYLTLDGPAHLYNGNIIKELLVNKHQAFSDLFIFNPLLVPNWSTHALFALLNLVFPDYISEKVVLVGYLILAPLFFRKICLHFTPENRFLSYLMIPFAHNHLLYLGSYNLVFGVAILLATVYYGIKAQSNFNVKYIILLAFLLLLVYLSHVMVLMITIAVVFTLPLSNLTVTKLEGRYVVGNVQSLWKNLLRTVIAVLPSLLLLLNYITNVDSLEPASRLDLMPLLRMLLDIRPLMTLAYGYPWIYFNWVLTSFFVVLLVGSLVYTIKHNAENRAGGFIFNFPAPRFSWIWFLISFCFTILFLIVPNANILPERLILFVFLFFILGISTSKYPKFLRNISIVIILFIQLVYVSLHVKNMKWLSHHAEQMAETTQFIDSGSFLLTLNYSDNWLDMHSAGYFGSGKPIAVLENYEGNLSWFPINWNVDGKYNLEPLKVWAADNKKMINSFYVNAPDTTVFSLMTKTNELVKIPYVVKFGHSIDMSSPDNIKTEEVLNQSYEEIFQNELCKLYRLK